MRSQFYSVLVFIITTAFYQNTFSQSLGINATGAPATNSSILDVSSTDKGMLVPRMNKAQRNAIVSPAIGLLVFQNAPDSAGFYYYDGTKWSWLAALNGNVDSLAWNRKGNAGTSPSVNFIGTTDNQALQFKVNNIKAGLIDHQKKNVLLGARAGFSLLNTSVENTIIGDSAFYNDNQILTSNVAIGYGVQAQSASAVSNNTVIGWNAGKNNTASTTTIIGSEAGQSNSGVGNVFVGSEAGMKNNNGTQNTFVGENAGRENVSGGSNSVFGSYAGTLGNGNQNCLFGVFAGFVTTGNANVFMGYGAGGLNTAGNYNVAIGQYALSQNTAGTRNVTVGANALFHSTTDSLNIAIGDSAGYSTNVAYRNIIIGAKSSKFLSGTGNTILGDYSAYKMGFSNHNVLIGDNVGKEFNSSANNAVVIGTQAGDSSIASWSTIVGNLAGRKNTIPGNTMIGSSAGENNTTGSTTLVGDNAGKNNTTGLITGLGYYAGYNNTTGTLTSLGYQAGYSNTTGLRNAYVGQYSGYRNVTGNYNSMFGEYAGYYNISSNNTFNGAYSGYNHSNGTDNSFLGYQAGFSDSSGAYNTCIGSRAGYANFTGSFNNFFGASAGAHTINGSSNCFFGTSIGQSLTLSTGNCAFGNYALLNSDTSSYNSVFGILSCGALTTGTANSALGYGSGGSLRSGIENTILGNEAQVGDTANYSISIGSQAGFKGDENVCIGYFSGFTGSSISKSNNVFIGSHAGYNRSATNSLLLGYSATLFSNVDNAIAIGANSRVDVSNAMVLGNSSVNVGIGVTSPTHAKLTMYSDALNGTPLSIFGYGQNGISIQQNWPTIGYNQYRDLAAANAAKYMGNGYAWVNTMEPTTGNMYWNSMPSGFANNAGGAETNRMTLTNSGFLGVNTSSPHAAIQVDNQLNNRRIVLWEQNNNTTEFFGFGINSGVLRYQIPNANAGNAHEFFAANTLLFTIFGNGNATLAGTLTQLSDARLKKDITPVSHALDDLNKLHAYNYYWIDETKDKDQQVGLLAQEVEKVFPQLVKKDAKGLLSVNYSGFTALLIKGMQEQQQMITDLKNEVDEMRQMIKNIAAGK